MGQQLKEQCLPLTEQQRRGGEIKERLHNSIVSKFQDHHKRRLDYANPVIFNAGLELEVFIVNQEAEPVPAYNDVAGFLNECVSPELIKCLLELKTQPGEVFGFFSSLEQLQKHLKAMYSAARHATFKAGLQALIVGGSPSYDPKKHGLLSDNPRYPSLKEFLDSFETNKFSIPFLGGSTNHSGMLWEGYAACMQLTIKTPYAFVSEYYDAGNLLGPLLLAASAASPFVLDRLTEFDSNRIYIMPQSVYGFSEEEKMAGRKGRMRFLDFPLTGNGVCEIDLDTELFSRLRDMDVEEGIARYVAHTVRDGVLLVTSSDLESPSIEGFPSPTCWPYAKIQYDKQMDTQGLLLEFRIGEILGSAEENASFLLTHLAMLQALAEDILKGRVKPLPGNLLEHNLLECAHRKQEKSVYWHDKKGNGKRALRDVFRYLSGRAEEVLKREGYSKDIPEILNPLISKIGLHYTLNRGIINIHREDSPAQDMRKRALEIQPDIAFGYPMKTQTRVAVLEKYLA